MSEPNNHADEIVRAESNKEERMSELAIIRTERAKLVAECSVTLPTDDWRRKNARLKTLGLKEQAIITELSMLNSRIKSLRSRPASMDQEPSMKKSRDAMAKWFMAVAYDVLDPAVFKQIADAALLRAQLPMERKSQPGDARSFNNSHWSR